MIHKKYIRSGQSQMIFDRCIKNSPSPSYKKPLSLKPYITVWIDNGDPKLTNIVIVRGLHAWLNVRWKMKSKQMMKVHPLNLNS